MKRFYLSLLCLVTISAFLCGCHTTNTDIIKDAVTDIDGNSYDAVKVGDQIWMCGNLTVKCLNDSTQIGDKFFKRNPYGCYYHTDIVKQDTSSAKLCPKGWHIPSKAEWETLVETVRGNSKWMSQSGNEAIALSTDMRGLEASGDTVYNSCGFSALPGGFRVRVASFPPTHVDQVMEDLGRKCYYWSSTINEENFDPFAMCIDASNGTAGLVKTLATYPIPSGSGGYPYVGTIFSNTYMPVRCVKD